MKSKVGICSTSSSLCLLYGTRDRNCLIKILNYADCQMNQEKKKRRTRLIVY